MQLLKAMCDCIECTTCSVQECSDNFKNLLSVFLWSKIGKLSCEVSIL